MLWYLMSKLYGLVDRLLFVSRNGIKMQFLGVVGLESSTLTVYCLSSWFVHHQQKNIFKFVCPLLTQSSIMISGTNGYSTLFLALSHKSWHYIKYFKKVISYGIVLLHNLFMMLKIGGVNLKYLWSSYKNIGMYYMWA